MKPPSPNRSSFAKVPPSASSPSGEAAPERRELVMPVPGGDHGEWQRSRSIAALRSGVGGLAGGNRSDRSRRVALGLGAYTPVVGRPSGTVTFLFTDVEGSTRLWAADSSAMSASLRAHDEILREAIESAGGYVFSTAGDSFAAAFDRVSAASELRWTRRRDWPLWRGRVPCCGCGSGCTSARPKNAAATTSGRP